MLLLSDVWLTDLLEINCEITRSLSNTDECSATQAGKRLPTKSTDGTAHQSNSQLRSQPSKTDVPHPVISAYGEIRCKLS